MRSRTLNVLAGIAALGLSGCIGLTLEPEERPFSRAVNDFNTQAELNARLLGESPTMFANVNITVIEGRVHLSGTVPTSEERITAARLAWATPNVREVANDIDVSDEADLIDAARDRWISAQVRGRILTDGSIRDVNYTIDTQNGVVFVLGIAQDAGELDRVLAHARAVGEARRVVNHVVLKDDPRRFEEYARTEQPVTGEGE